MMRWWFDRRFRWLSGRQQKSFFFDGKKENEKWRIFSSRRRCEEAHSMEVVAREGIQIFHSIFLFTYICHFTAILQATSISMRCDGGVNSIHFSDFCRRTTYLSKIQEWVWGQACFSSAWQLRVLFYFVVFLLVSSSRSCASSDFLGSFFLCCVERS